MNSAIPLVGLSNEQRRVASALRNREPLLLLGAAGAGKTRLILSALESLSEASDVLYVNCPVILHDLLVQLARALLRTGHETFIRTSAAGSNTEEWLSRQTSLHLKGLLWGALEAEPRTIVLDGVAGAGHRTFRFLQRLYYAPGMCIAAAARDIAALGALTKLLWDPRRVLYISSLTDRESEQLFELAAEYFRLHRLDLDDFRERALEAARGNPGQIVEMCRLATNPRYVSGSYIKFAPLRIDMMMKFAR